MPTQITITGRVPSKKNSTWTIMVKGRPIRLPSQKYKEWNRDWKNLLKGTPRIDPKGMILDFWFPDHRKTDMSNKMESVMDLLVDVGILEDDCWTVTGPISLIPHGVDKFNPRIVITFIV